MTSYPLNYGDDDAIEVAAWFNNKGFPFKVTSAILCRLWSDEESKISDRNRDFDWANGERMWETGTRIDMVIEDPRIDWSRETLDWCDRPKDEIDLEQFVSSILTPWVEANIPSSDGDDDLRGNSDIAHPEIRDVNDCESKPYGPNGQGVLLINFYGFTLEQVAERLGLLQTPPAPRRGGFEFL
jgi:hypothetical protein